MGQIGTGSAGRQNARAVCEGGRAMEEKRPGVFAVLGEDARQRAAADYLREKGFEVRGPEGVAAANWVLLPMPLAADAAALEQLLAQARPGTAAFGGRVSEAARAAAAAAGIRLEDYLCREELALLNAIPTAEGCIGLILQNRRRTVWGSSMLVLGFGRCGQALAVRLAALGAHVTVAARSPAQRALALSLGLAAVPMDAVDGLLEGTEVAVNTVPAPVLDAARLQKLPAGALVIDLASLPGGTDFEAAKVLGVRAIHALSLPARCAPVTAGQFVAQAVLAMLRERGEGF